MADEAQLVIGSNVGMLKRYIGICKHIPVHRTICRYIDRVCTGASSSSDHSMTDAECAHGVPGHLPELLPRSPDCACLFHRGAQFRFVPRDPHADDVVIVAPWTPRAAAPRRLLDDEFDRLQPPAADFVVEGAHEKEAPAVACNQPLRARHARTQRQSDFHRTLSRT